MDCLLNNDTMVDLLLSSSSSSLSSSTFSFPDDMLDDLADMQDASNDPMLEQLIQATQQLNRQINEAIEDDAINWGNVPTIEDHSDSDCVANCHMRKSSLQILADKMWPKFSAIFGDDKNRIKCKNQYTIHYESGLIILLYRYSLPCHLRPDMEKIFGIRKSHLSTIIQSFSEALYQISNAILLSTYIQQNKHLVYMRFKKCHGLKFQSVLIPNGFIACLYGPVPAKTHDARLLCESQLLEQLQTVMPEEGNNPIYALYVI